MSLPPRLPPSLRHVFERPSAGEQSTVAQILRRETVGGGLLLFGAFVAIVWVNSPWREAYDALLHVTVGPRALRLDLDLQHWVGDGLLAIFFFVAGLELKRELVVGALSSVRRALVPVVAAVSGVVVPAGLFLAVTAGTPGAGTGWAVPVATDIAFALAVLAVLGSHLPTAMRTFLLTLAVVDDLLAITIIAVFYTHDMQLWALGMAVLPLGLFAVVVRYRASAWWALLPLAATTWALVHASGVHATVAGVALAFTVPARQPFQRSRRTPGESPAAHLEHVVRPVSAGVAVPLFALTAAGVHLDVGSLGRATSDPVFLGVVVGLVAGKLIGVFLGTYLTARLSRAELDEDLAWSDVAGVSLLAGIGFTVCLLIGELAYAADPQREATVRLAVLSASLLAAVLASGVLLRRSAVHRRNGAAASAASAPAG